MRRSTKRRLSTIIGVALGGITLTGPLAGQLLWEWQHKRGLCGCATCRATWSDK